MNNVINLPKVTLIDDDELAAKLASSPRPRVTLERIHSRIVTTEFFHHGLLTLCILTLTNGFTVVGESACVDPGNYDAAIGDKIAKDNAVQKIWPLEGYLLAEVLHQTHERA